MQRGSDDCALAAISTLTGIPYRKVSEKAVTLFARPHKSGLWISDGIKLAKALGITLVETAGIIEDDATGILVLANRKRERHWVVLFQGVVQNPSDGLVYDLETFLAVKGWRIVAFLT